MKFCFFGKNSTRKCDFIVPSKNQHFVKDSLVQTVTMC